MVKRLIRCKYLQTLDFFIGKDKEIGYIHTWYVVFRKKEKRIK
jgi:hypothetical protein